jgi:hypothetical protein
MVRVELMPGSDKGWTSVYEGAVSSSKWHEIGFDQFNVIAARCSFHYANTDGKLRLYEFQFEDSSDPTLALVGSFDAYIMAGNLVVEWETLSEIATVGFYLERYSPKSGIYEKVNDRIVPSCMAGQGGLYRLIDENGAGEGRIKYRLIEVERGNRSREHGPFSVIVNEPSPALSQGSKQSAAINRVGPRVSRSKLLRLRNLRKPSQEKDASSDSDYRTKTKSCSGKQLSAEDAQVLQFR